MRIIYIIWNSIVNPEPCAADDDEWSIRPDDDDTDIITKYGSHCTAAPQLLLLYYAPNGHRATRWNSYGGNADLTGSTTLQAAVFLIFNFFSLLPSRYVSASTFTRTAPVHCTQQTRIIKRTYNNNNNNNRYPYRREIVRSPRAAYIAL